MTPVRRGEAIEASDDQWPQNGPESAREAYTQPRAISSPPDERARTREFIKRAEIRVVIPGPPFSQPRPRARAFGGYAQVYEPKEARSWKGAAQVHMQEALRAAGLATPAFSEGPLEALVFAVFPCPKSDYRKRDPIGRRPYTGLKDWDNIGKATCDAANGVLYLDDRLIARGTVECWIGAQGEAPYVEIVVRAFDVTAPRLQPQQPALFGAAGPCACMQTRPHTEDDHARDDSEPAAGTSCAAAAPTAE